MILRHPFCVVLALILAIVALPAVAQVQSNNCQVVGGAVICTVKETDPQAIGPLHVPNYSKVVIRITEKSPFDDCVLADVKLEEIKTQDPVAGILQLLAKSVTGISFPEKGPGSSLAMLSAINKNEKIVIDTPEKKLLFDLTILNEEIDNRRVESLESIESQQDAAMLANDLFRAPPRSRDKYDEKVGPVMTKLQDILDSPEPSFESEQIRYAILHDRLKAYLTNPPDDSKDTDDKKRARAETVQQIEEALNIAAGNLDAVKANYELIKAGRSEFRKLGAYLELSKKTGEYSVELRFVPNVQTKASSSFSCVNTYTKKIAPAQVPVTVLFEAEPHLSVSVGVLLSTIPKRKLGVTQIRTGTDSNGVSTFKTVLAEVDKAPVQVVPLAFLNYRILALYRPKKNLNRKDVTLHLSLGVGVNPNSGSNEVEFFVGSAIRYRNYFFQFGDHIGRYQDGFTGGFKIGDTVPSNFPGSLPIHRVYRNGFGAALSYRLPF